MEDLVIYEDNWLTGKVAEDYEIDNDKNPLRLDVRKKGIAAKFAKHDINVIFKKGADPDLPSPRTRKQYREHMIKHHGEYDD